MMREEPALHLKNNELNINLLKVCMLSIISQIISIFSYCLCTNLFGLRLEVIYCNANLLKQILTISLVTDSSVS